jgi:NADPH:quinone reductase-like Zn-dependent oxidoreductase
VRSYRQTSPTGIDALEMVEEASPAPGPGQVLVRVHATSLNFRDPILANGQYPFPSRPGLVPLSDAAGEIERVGEGVTRFAVGDRVVDSFNVGWHGGKMRSVGLAYGADIDGWLTERRVVSEHELAPLPVHLSFEEGATLPCVAVTAWSALADVGPGDTVLTQGSGGSRCSRCSSARRSGRGSSSPPRARRKRSGYESSAPTTSSTTSPTRSGRGRCSR